MGLKVMKVGVITPLFMALDKFYGISKFKELLDVCHQMGIL
jgi:hypothetical protein